MEEEDSAVKITVVCRDDPTEGISMLHRLSNKWVAPVIAVLVTLGVVLAVNSIRADSAARARHATAAHPVAAAAPTTPPTQIVLSQTEGAWSLAFSEMSSYTSKIDPVPVTTPTSKQFGTPERPRVVLKRNLDIAGNQLLDAWHQRARFGDPAARLTVFLTIDQGGRTFKYLMHDAWISNLTISGPTAGSNQPAVETVTIVCEAMFLQQ
jgi:hypothetical protein